MKTKLQVASCRLPVPDRNLGARLSLTFNLQPPTFNLLRAFTLIEVMVAMALLSLIVIALMGVFSSTQSAFRASVTQTDVLEGGRAAMDLITGDLRALAPSGLAPDNGANANLWVGNYYGYPPLLQSLVGVNNPNTTRRTNILENIFILSRGNLNGVPTWYGTGYAVLTNDPSGSLLYPLYRFAKNYPMATTGAVSNLFFRDFVIFLNALPVTTTNYSHLLDGVVGLRLHAFDANGTLINTTRQSFGTNTLVNVPGEVGYYFYSNALPASVEIEMATLEDRPLQRAASLPYGSFAQSNYLAQQAGKVHVFRQRVAIPNVDPSVYQ